METDGTFSFFRRDDSSDDGDDSSERGVTKVQ